MSPTLPRVDFQAFPVVVSALVFFSTRIYIFKAWKKSLAAGSDAELLHFERVSVCNVHPSFVGGILQTLRVDCGGGVV